MSIAAPEIAKIMPASASTSPSRRTPAGRPARWSPGGSIDARRVEHLGGHDEQADRQQAAEPIAHDRVEAVDAEVLLAPALLLGARRVEVDLVRHERGRDEASTKYQYSVEPCDSARSRHRPGPSPGRSAAPPRRTPAAPARRSRRGARSSRTAAASRRGRRRCADEHEGLLRPVEEQRQRQPDAAELGGQRQEGEDERRDERREPEAPAEALAHQLESSPCPRSPPRARTSPRRP